MCTANICRSPLAEALLRGRLTSGPHSVDVASAGFLTAGRAVPEEMVAAASPYGADLSGHRSRQLSPADVTGADLVVGMARRHVRDVLLLDPGCLPRAFTLKELVRQGEKVGARGAGTTVGEWLAAVHEGRSRLDLLGASPEDDVADPFGGSPADYRAAADELHDLVDRLVRVLWPTS